MGSWMICTINSLVHTLTPRPTSSWPVLTLITYLSPRFMPSGICVTVDIICSLRWEDKVAVHSLLLSRAASSLTPPPTPHLLSGPRFQDHVPGSDSWQAQGWWVSIAQPPGRLGSLLSIGAAPRLSSSHHLANDVHAITLWPGKRP